MNAGESVEDKSDVIVADGTIFWALNQIYDCYETRVDSCFWTLCIETILKENFQKNSSMNSDVLWTFLRIAEIIYNTTNIFQELLAQRYNLDHKFQNLQKLFMFVNYLRHFFRNQTQWFNCWKFDELLVVINKCY